MEYKVIITPYDIRIEFPEDADADKKLLILQEIKEKIEIAIDRIKKEIKEVYYE